MRTGASSPSHSQPEEHLKTLGLVNEHGYEYFGGCLTVPLYDEAGTVVDLYGRKLNDSGAVKHLYSSGGHKGLVNGKAPKVYAEVILTESILDCLSLIQLRDRESSYPSTALMALLLPHLQP